MLKRSSIAPLKSAVIQAEGDFELFCAEPMDLQKISKWENFVLSINRIFSHAHSIKDSGSYFKDLFSLRRNDHIFQYLHQSRHHLEHNFESKIAVIRLKILEILNDPEELGIRFVSLSGEDDLGRRFDIPVGSGPTISSIAINEFHLCNVQNEGVDYAPPHSEEGKQFTAEEVGAIAISMIKKEIYIIERRLINKYRRHSGLTDI